MREIITFDESADEFGWLDEEETNRLIEEASMISLLIIEEEKSEV